MSYRDPSSAWPTASKSYPGISLAQGAQRAPRSLPLARDPLPEDRPDARSQTMLRAPQAAAIDKPVRPNAGPRPLPPTRRFDTYARLASGEVVRQQHIAPALVVFEAAFSGFARGTLVETDQGLFAVEDLEPGMMLDTVDHGMRRLDWIGSMTALPINRPDAPAPQGMIRIMVDSFGMGKPMADVMAGPAARMLRAPHSNETRGLMPCAVMEDGNSVIRIHPPRPVATYHLCLDRHAAIKVAGIALESYHPGPDLHRQMGPAMLSVFLSLFPHIRTLGDFGPLAYPHLG